MGTVLKLLANPKNLLILALAVLLAMTWFVGDARKHKILTMESAAVKCEAQVTGYKAEMSAANAIIEALKANLEGIKKQAAEWQRIASEAKSLRLRIIELQNTPRECEVLQNEYSKVASDIVVYFNGGVRGKINRPGPAGDRAAGEVLPGTDKAGPAGPRDDAPAAR